MKLRPRKIPILPLQLLRKVLIYLRNFYIRGKTVQSGLQVSFTFQNKLTLHSCIKEGEKI